MRRLTSLVFVIALLLAGAYLTAQSARGVPLFARGDTMSPEASVFAATADQKVMLVAAIVGVVVVTLGLSIALAIVVRQLDKGYRRTVANRTEKANAHNHTKSP